jgi:hypothetical protein
MSLTAAESYPWRPNSISAASRIWSLLSGLLIKNNKIKQTFKLNKCLNKKNYERRQGGWDENYMMFSAPQD